ncbi:hypothetical protein CC1G_10048 [Coprinopsis cinerea okayama7|uniref:Uncharacterized protein n=1 Tax=Coprinopsis cinerea (strain Okayama-7 / 130 / ATCC MYA-4618 / FGSC 9003) TaxID=240176 RepID=A8NUX3_COPC7|nr:hypothetical protein CC1G_10048 [Coprinopsis cinerea okayama7\|eukprot:XP_001836554.2 hypothetical protein CC1G_10048 [Coprinopsis cinerea okayama7\
MAAVVNRVVSTLSDAGSHHQQRTPQTSSIEVIDVDLLDDDVGQRPTGSRAPSQRHSQPRDTISLLDDDSDDEVQVIQVRRPTRPIERERLFSPPPPQMQRIGSNPPPVPRVPRRYASQTSFVGRSRTARATAPSVPPVVPVDREFPFERLAPTRPPSPPVAGPSNASRDIQAPRAAPRSNHVPSLGLGGGLIAHNRARLMAERRNRPFNPLRRIYPPPSYGDFLDFDFGDDWGRLADLPGPGQRLEDRYRSPLREPEHYLPGYTHPCKAEAGFTYSFAPSSPTESSPPGFPTSSSSNPIVIKDDDEEEANAETAGESTKPVTTLVCARCLDLLVLNSGLFPSQATERRIWGLRCGHLIDGKCLHEIGQPPMVLDLKGKGKAKAEPATLIPYGEEPNTSSSSLLQDETNIPREPSPEGNTIRSRLRSQTQLSSSSSTPANSHRSHNPTPSHDPSTAVPPSPSGSRKRKRGAAKSAAGKKNKVEEEFEWRCPVPNCGHLHVSVKINGVWGPEKERQIPMKRGAASIAVLSELEKGPRGAIPVFA